MKKINFIETCCLMLVMLVTGVFWGTWFTLTRTMENFSSDCFLAIGKTIISNVKTPMQILMPSTIVFLILLSIFTYNTKRKFRMVILSLALMAITLYITIGIEVPIDNQVKTWKSYSLPANWEQLRDKWKFFHCIRTFSSIASFLALCLSISINGKNKNS